MSRLLAFFRHLRTYATLKRARGYINAYGRGIHIGRGSRFWARDSITIGDHVYIGKDVHIEANCIIGSYCLIANRVAIVGRHDHDFRAVGYPVRYAPWIGGRDADTEYRSEKAIIEDDVWLGYGAIVMTGLMVGRGSIVAAGSVVTKDVPRYSIVAGNPAREVGRRFPDSETIRRHEQAIATGRYEFSERGYDHWIVEPGK